MKVFKGLLFFVALPICAGFLMRIEMLSRSQAASAPLRFEVASIKPNRSGIDNGNMEFPPNGRVNIVNATFKQMMMASYRLRDYQIIGGPDWITTNRFDIQAKPSDEFKPKPTAPCFGPDCPMTSVQIMMQELLGDRFQLKIHRETRELPIYELTIGKNGFKLKEVDPQKPRVASPPPPPGTPPPTTLAAVPTPPPGAILGFRAGLAGSAVPIAVLASELSRLLGRPVIDKTGIKGDYDFKLIYSPVALNGPPGPAVPLAGLEASDPMPLIFTAVQEQLGLRLDSTKGAVEVLVIDHVEKPSEGGRKR